MEDNKVYIGFDRLKEENKDLYDKYKSIENSDKKSYFIYLTENPYTEPKYQDFNNIIMILNKAVKEKAKIVIIDNLRFVVRFSIGGTALVLYLELLDHIKDSIGVEYERSIL